MSNPTKGDVHVNAVLSNVSIAMMQSASNFIATQVFPNIPVSKSSDRYFTYDRGEFNRDEMEERAPGTESAGGGYKLDNSPTYATRTYAFHKDIPDQIRANADSVLALDREATAYVTQKGLIKREKIFAANYFTTGVWTNELVGANPAVAGTSVLYWNNASAIPIEDVRNAQRTVLEDTGYEPNTLVLGKKVYDNLVDNPEIIERIDRGQTPGGPAMGNIAKLMALFEVERVFVMKAIENTSNEVTTAFDHEASHSSYFSHSFIGGKHALLCYSAPSPGLMTPTAGYTFSWTGLLGSGANGGRIKRFYLDAIESERVEIELSFDMKLVSAELGFFFYNVVE